MLNEGPFTRRFPDYQHIPGLWVGFMRPATGDIVVLHTRAHPFFKPGFVDAAREALGNVPGRFARLDKVWFDGDDPNKTLKLSTIIYDSKKWWKKHIRGVRQAYRKMHEARHDADALSEPFVALAIHSVDEEKMDM